MKTFHLWPDWLLGSTLLSDPYQTASARPGPPALIHGKTLTASPVPVEPSLTCTGGVQFDHPLAALAPLTKTCRFVQSLALIFQTTYRLRAESMESTEKSVSGDPVGVSASLTSFVRSWPLPVASRKWSVPVASGVPMLRKMPFAVQPLLILQPAAWKPLPVT